MSNRLSPIMMLIACLPAQFWGQTGETYPPYWPCNDFDADDRMGDGVDGMVAHPLSFSTALLNMQYADDFGSQGAIIAVEMVEVSNRGADHSDPRLCHIERLMPMTADAENFVLDSESD